MVDCITSPEDLVSMLSVGIPPPGALALLLQTSGNPLQRKLERMSAMNVVREARGPVISLGGRLKTHTDPDAFPMKRKRVQPRGSRPCPDCNARTISANADRCAACAERKNS